MKDLIACCGLDCENCDARKATVNNDDALRKKTAKQWAEANDAPYQARAYQLYGMPDGGREVSLLRRSLSGPQVRE